jgi:hypothetical protein
MTSAITMNVYGLDRANRTIHIDGEDYLEFLTPKGGNIPAKAPGLSFISSTAY